MRRGRPFKAPSRREQRAAPALAPATSIVAIFRKNRLIPTDRRQKDEWRVPPGQENGAQEGDIVEAAPLPGRFLGRVVRRIGRSGDAGSISLICIAQHQIPQVFGDAVLDEAKRARRVALGKREDLRELPLVTIDGQDARDFDDAVFAEADGTGHRLVVAIADVAHYVRPGAALDNEARDRGNSVYFPDRVVPMLPEALSNGWCSLQPAEERGCLFVEMRVDADGNKLSHRFGRGLMRSSARLTYEQAQAMQDGGEASVAALYRAFRALLAARVRRGTLDLDLPERKITLDDQGRVTEIAPRPRLESHRLIEEFMVLANVCAAEELERRHLPCMFRIHPPPSDEKRENLRNFLQTFGIRLPPGNNLLPRDLDRVLHKAAGTPEAQLVNEMVLRSQSQAVYSPDNIGHFGLALPRYAHFTSPIRRYADLLVHRALIRGLKLGTDGLSDSDAAQFGTVAEHITAAERRAVLAERDSTDRYVASFLAGKVGMVFPARVSGVTRFGLFVTLDGTGANGLVPMSGLPEDYWQHDEASQSLLGRHTKKTFRLADRVEVRLAEAAPATGGMIFHISASRRDPAMQHKSKSLKKARGQRK